jgi:mevalonate kinase
MTYPSKVLLFGEHILMHGASALAAPLRLYGGQWAWSAADAQGNQMQLHAWADYLHAMQEETGLDVDAFQADLRKGLSFQSNIPAGYGLGSSGALCAAVYDRYARRKIDAADTARLPELRQVLALMEGFFHGASSGADPLICYLDHPVLLKPDGGIELVSLPSLQAKGLSLFLLDSGRSRQTGPLVQYFRERCQDPAFEQKVQAQLITGSDAAITAWLEDRLDDMYEHFLSLSAFHLEHLAPMIPEELWHPWQEGLESGRFALKLCGAGGGGFFLGIAEGFRQAESALRSWKLEDSGF